MPLPIYIVDAFTDRPFRGNPAGVCLLDEQISHELMQQIAAEMNQAETAFLLKIGDGNYNLRWFTPTNEVQMCGHATLASAHILWETRKENGSIRFQTRSGEMLAERERDLIILNFPSEFTTPVSNVTQFEEALRVKVSYVGDNRLYWLIELQSEQAIRDFSPDLAAISKLGRNGVVITAKSESEADDFASRFFGPNIGIPEDPVTGSAHCLLTPYWAKKLGKTEMLGYQASQRGGFIQVEFLGARVLLKGYAAIVLRGEILLG